MGGEALWDARRVPVTFLAHQAAVLPIQRRWPRCVDGVAAVAGSAAPDLAYVTRGWWGPGGIPMWFDGHRLQNVLVTGAVASIIAALTRRVVLRVLPLALWDAGSLHLHDYRTLAFVRHRWWVTFASALIGIATHLVLDTFTHEDGSGVGLFGGALSARVVVIGGRSVHGYTVLQYGGSLLMAGYVCWCVLRFGRERSFLDPRVPTARLASGATVLFWAIVGVSSVISVAYGSTRLGRLPAQREIENKSVAVISACWVAFAGLLLASLAVVDGVVEDSGGSHEIADDRRVPG